MLKHLSTYQLKTICYHVFFMCPRIDLLIFYLCTCIYIFKLDYNFPLTSMLSSGFVSHLEKAKEFLLFFLNSHHSL
jgi:hypothetical protein